MTWSSHDAPLPLLPSNLWFYPRRAKASRALSFTISSRMSCQLLTENLNRKIKPSKHRGRKIDYISCVFSFLNSVVLCCLQASTARCGNHFGLRDGGLGLVLSIAMGNARGWMVISPNPFGWVHWSDISQFHLLFHFYTLVLLFIMDRNIDSTRIKLIGTYLGHKWNQPNISIIREYIHRHTLTASFNQHELLRHHQSVPPTHMVLRYMDSPIK